jgi:flavin reductase (DIM6/NTAB) family NADH-FMN oxidoreductase RutF
MSIAKPFRKFIKKAIFGNALLPQAFTIGLAEPQTEIAVWLHGMGKPIDVTCRHSMACADPFTVCISFDEGEEPSEIERSHLALSFCEREGQRRVLGRISLSCQKATQIPAVGRKLILFEARSSANYCLPKARILAYYLLHRYLLWRKADVAGIKMSFLERRAVMVMFIRPHPVVLVSLRDEVGGNIFPMNIMGDLDGGYFAFALKNSRLAARLVERAGAIALSDVPLSQTSLAYRLGVNHGRQSINWGELSFATKTSAKLNIPVPVFSHRIRELQIETIRDLGSHTFFVARIIHEERSGENIGLCIVHGFYQAWRLKDRREELQTSLADDLLNKRGAPYSSLPL